MSNLESKRQHLKEQNQIGLKRFGNRAYINKDVMLLRDFIAQEISKFTYTLEKKGYKVDSKDVDTMTQFVFKPKDEQEEEERLANDLWEDNTSLALLPIDTVIDKTSRFAYQYNWRSNISSKYFLLDTYGLNSRKDIENNRQGRPILVDRKVQSVTKVREEIIRPKLTIKRYYYKGKQITQGKAYEKIKLLKNDIEEVVYKVNKKLKRIYINIKTDERVYKKDAFKDIYKLRKGVKIIKSKYLGKKEIKKIVTRSYKQISFKYRKVNYFAQTYKNYLPYFLFMRLAKKVIPANRRKRVKEHIEERIKFYISTYVDKNGNAKYIPSKIRNGRDIIANSDMIGNVVMPQLVKSDIIKSLIKDDNRVRLKQGTDSSYRDIPVSFLFFVGQKNLLREKKYRQSIKDEDIIDVQSEEDTGKMKDTSSLDINENKDYLVDIRSNDKEKIRVENKELKKLEEDLEIEQEIKKYFSRRRIKEITTKNISDIIGIITNSINIYQERMKYLKGKELRFNEKMLNAFMDIKYDLDEINNITTKKEQDKQLKQFNIDLQNRYKKTLEKLELKEKQYIQPIEDRELLGDKVNLLKQYYNKIVNEINNPNPIEIRS